ncbi:CU044_5270 family protein [Arthrobacter sp. zg-Y411]|uniref:CU044_5270 family protein n=1 Tax=Arthrobacter zhangbolii TaxID=2886936 RepID=UPI001D141BA6|nr:CU044_5270 family protein [Arthrobacter zhangbolii]MCC3293970.1 CU044_5270 family protein [Arthrobacter zhangbolii]
MMNKNNLPDSIEHRLLSADPARSVRESDLARSRAKSLAVRDAPSAAENTSPSPLHAVPPLPGSAAPAALRVRRRVLLASAAAALLVAGIVVADVVRPGGPGATAEAAQVLNAAADATIRSSDPVVGPGQYLLTDTTTLFDTGVEEADGSSLSWQATVTDRLYIPADKDGEWVWDRGALVPLDSSSEAAKAAAAQLDELGEGVENPAVGIQRSPGGAFYGDPPVTIIGSPLQEAGNLPRDPQALLELVYERADASGGSRDGDAFITIAMSLRSGVVPADLRAALYQAAALIPGVIIGDTQATVDGRTGVAIGFPFEDIERYDIIIDPASGLVIGEQHVRLKDLPDAPAGTIVTWTSVRTSVVDAAP